LVFLTELLDEMIEQERDVLLSFPERGEMDFHGVDPVEEILPERKREHENPDGKDHQRVRHPL
jgi:hypothetical protein